jgi:hypothetical protein
MLAGCFAIHTDETRPNVLVWLRLIRGPFRRGSAFFEGGSTQQLAGAPGDALPTPIGTRMRLFGECAIIHARYRSSRAATRCSILRRVSFRP